MRSAFDMTGFHSPEQTVMTVQEPLPGAVFGAGARPQGQLCSERTRCYNQPGEYHKSVTIDATGVMRGIQQADSQLQCRHRHGDAVHLWHRRRCSLTSTDRSQTDHPQDVIRRQAVLDCTARTSRTESPQYARPHRGPACARDRQPTHRGLSWATSTASLFGAVRLDPLS